MTYAQALTFLESLINYERAASVPFRSGVRLERMERLMQALGNPQRRFRSLLVAGTKGKGSTCAFLYAMLREAGFRVGCYTSPHLVDVRERIRVAPSPDRLGWIGREVFGRLMERVQRQADRVSGEPGLGPVTYFEALTALAFVYLAEVSVELAVLEVGMGGRLDATNVSRPVVCGITPISFDHTQELGPTLAAIAREKAGIIRPESIVVSAPQEREAMHVIRGVCEEQRARLYEVGRHAIASDRAPTASGQWFALRGIVDEYAHLDLPLHGAHQVVNAAVAVTMVDALRLAGCAVPPEAVRAGLAGVEWAGRFQILSRDPTVILDGAQNGASADALAATVREVFPGSRAVLVIGVSVGKDLERLAAALAPLAARVIATQSQHPRAHDPEVVRAAFQRVGCSAVAGGTVAEALAAAQRQVARGEVIVVTGSLYVVGEALAALGPGRGEAARHAAS